MFITSTICRPASRWPSTVAVLRADGLSRSPARTVKVFGFSARRFARSVATRANPPSVPPLTGVSS